MAQQQIITFDPDVAVPYGVNLTIFSGADFNTTFTVRTSAGSSIDFSNYTGKSNMKKSAIGTANTFGVTLGDTNGRVTLPFESPRVTPKVFAVPIADFFILLLPV